MQQNPERQKKAQEQALQLLESAEKKRAAIRLERGLTELLSDRFQILNNQEFTESVASHLYDALACKGEDNSLVVLDKLFFQLIAGESKYHLVITSILEKIGDASLKASNIRIIQILCRKFIEVLESTDKSVLLSSKVCEFLAQGCILFIRSSLWKDADTLLSTLWSMRRIVLETVNGAYSPVPQIVLRIAKNDVLEKIVQYHNNGNRDIRDKARITIKMLGDNAISYLLNRLIYSTTKEERFLIMELIGGFGDKAEDEIKKCLGKDLPWYVIRNIIYIISELRLSVCYSLVEGYLLHPDIRVQQQLVNAIVKIGGVEVEKRLAQALAVVQDEIKIRLVMQLGAYHGEEIAKRLVDLLLRKNALAVNVRNELILTTVISLRSFPYANVIDALIDLRQECIAFEGADNNILIAIEETINILEPKLRHLEKGENIAVDTLRYAFDPENERNAAKRVAVFMDEIAGLLKKGDREGAGNRIYKKIIESAREKDFHTAELLGDKLLSINPDALQDVIRASEIIEEQKNTPASTLHFEIWEELYEKMSTDAFDAFYHCLTQENYSSDERIVATNEIDDCLYFINAGIVRLSCSCNNEEVFLKRLKPGDVIGVGQFFSVSVWTVSLTAQQDTQLHVLRRKDFLKVIERFPAVEDILFDFCNNKEEIQILVRMSGKDRRNHARYPVNVIVNNTLLNPYGGSTGKRIFQGEMLDISKGGLSFSIKISKKENAHLLLGRQIISEVNLLGNEVLKCFGVIVGVRDQNAGEKEFSIHVKFYTEIEQRQVTNVLNLVI